MSKGATMTRRGFLGAAMALPLVPRLVLAQGAKPAAGAPGVTPEAIAARLAELGVKVRNQPVTAAENVRPNRPAAAPSISHTSAGKVASNERCLADICSRKRKTREI